MIERTVIEQRRRDRFEGHTFGGLGFFDVGGGRDAMITDKTQRKGSFLLSQLLEGHSLQLEMKT
jgi:hypothetical protein